MFVAIPYTQKNQLRTRLYLQLKMQGYTMASYVSSRAFVWSRAQIGEHCFIFENNVVQPFVEMKENIILWSGNHIGHHSIIRRNCFIASHVVISGHCDIGENCFIGVNCTVAHQVSVGENCLLGAGTLVLKNIPAGTILRGKATEYEMA